MSDQHHALTEKVDIVVVSFSGEIASLLLQARSIDKFFEKSLLNKYVVVWNEDSAFDIVRERVIREAPGLINHLVIVPRSRFMSEPGRAKGWLTQQIAKVGAVAECSTPYALVFDTKNHLIAPVDQSDLFSDDHLPYVTLLSYANKSAFGELLRGGLNYFSVEETAELLTGLPTTTPYMMYTDVYRSMIEEVEAKEGTPFDEAFLRGGLRYKSTEFLLYYAFFLKLGLRIEDRYRPADTRSVTFFKSSPKDGAAIKMRLNRLRHPSIKFLAVHRVRMAKLTRDEREGFEAIWLGAGLFKSADEVDAFVHSFVAPSHDA